MRGVPEGGGGVNKDEVVFSFAIRAIEAHPSRLVDAKALKDTPVPVTLNPNMPEDELHIISDGMRIVMKLGAPKS